jgi:phosphate transport system protein
MPVGDRHIVQSFDNELGTLTNLTAELGTRAEAVLKQSLRALAEGDSALAIQTAAAAAETAALEEQVHAQVIRVLALRSPMADDLRRVVATLRIAGEYKRIAELAAGTSRRLVTLAAGPAIPAGHGMVQMGWLTVTQLHDVNEAYLQGDQALAERVWSNDSQVDAVYSSLYRELLTYMIEDARKISACSELLFIAKNIERIGDHVTNVAEMVTFAATGQTLKARPKADTSLVDPG